MPGIEYATPELQDNEVLKGFDSPDALAKGYLDLQTKITAGDLSILPKELQDNETVKFYKNVPEAMKGLIETKKLVGTIKKAPEKPDGYKFTPVQDLHPGIQNIEGTQKALAEYFHKIGLDTEKADLVQQGFLNMISQSLKNQEAARVNTTKENETKLRAEWGADYDKNMDKVINVIKRIGGDEAVNAFNFKNAPVALKVLGKVVNLLSEDSIGKLGEHTESLTTDKAKAVEEINKMIADQWHSKYKGAEYESKKKEWDRLHGVAYGPG